MSESLVLTNPEVTPAKQTTEYRIVFVMKNIETQVFEAHARGTNGELIPGRYEGDTAVQMIKQLNKADLSAKSEQKRILERFRDDGILKPGTVSGTPD